MRPVHLPDQDGRRHRAQETQAEILSQTTEQVIVLEPAELLSFCGRNDQRIRQLESGLRASIRTRGNEIVVSGETEEVDLAVRVIQDLLGVQRATGHGITGQQVAQALRGAQSNETGLSLKDIYLDRIPLPNRSKHVAPISYGQKHYLDAIRRSEIVCAIGPAGTGKTYLAVAMGVFSLMEGLVRRIILVRPAVEAGERLGFLPGDIAAKFDPFVRPLYDALYEMMDPEKVKTYLETGIIEIAPLAFMRGRTLNDSFVILDEGQNTTAEQMKMFLTRMGNNSRIVVTGDITQVDLPEGKTSGLSHIQSILRDIKGIEFIYFDEKDVVRHPLVQKIVLAYEREKKQRS